MTHTEGENSLKRSPGEVILDAIDVHPQTHLSDIPQRENIIDYTYRKHACATDSNLAPNR